MANNSTGGVRSVARPTVGGRFTLVGAQTYSSSGQNPSNLQPRSAPNKPAPGQPVQVSSSLYEAQYTTPQGKVQINYTRQGNTLVPTAIGKNVTFVQPVNQTSGGYTVIGSQTYNYSIQGKQLVPTLQTTQGQVTYNGQPVATLTNTGAVPVKGATVSQVISGGGYSNLGTVVYSPVVNNGTVSLAYSSFVPALVTINGVVKEEVAPGQYVGVGTSTTYQTSFNSATGVVSLNAQPGVNFPTITAPLTLGGSSTLSISGFETANFSASINGTTGTTGAATIPVKIAGYSGTIITNVASGNAPYLSIYGQNVFNGQSFTLFPTTGAGASATVTAETFVFQVTPTSTGTNFGYSEKSASQIVKLGGYSFLETQTASGFTLSANGRTGNIINVGTSSNVLASVNSIGTVTLTTPPISLGSVITGGGTTVTQNGAVVPNILNSNNYSTYNKGATAGTGSTSLFGGQGSPLQNNLGITVGSNILGTIGYQKATASTGTTLSATNSTNNIIGQSNQNFYNPFQNATLLGGIRQNIQIGIAKAYVPVYQYGINPVENFFAGVASSKNPSISFLGYTGVSFASVSIFIATIPFTITNPNYPNESPVAEVLGYPAYFAAHPIQAGGELVGQIAGLIVVGKAGDIYSGVKEQILPTGKSLLTQQPEYVNVAGSLEDYYNGAGKGSFISFGKGSFISLAAKGGEETIGGLKLIGTGDEGVTVTSGPTLSERIGASINNIVGKAKASFVSTGTEIVNMPTPPKLYIVPQEIEPIAGNPQTGAGLGELRLTTTQSAQGVLTQIGAKYDVNIFNYPNSGETIGAGTKVIYNNELGRFYEGQNYKAGVTYSVGQYGGPQLIYGIRPEAGVDAIGKAYSDIANSLKKPASFLYGVNTNQGDVLYSVERTSLFNVKLNPEKAFGVTTYKGGDIVTARIEGSYQIQARTTNEAIIEGGGGTVRFTKTVNSPLRRALGIGPRTLPAGSETFNIEQAIGRLVQTGNENEKNIIVNKITITTGKNGLYAYDINAHPEVTLSLYPLEGYKGGSIFAGEATGAGRPVEVLIEDVEKDVGTKTYQEQTSNLFKNSPKSYGSSLLGGTKSEAFYKQELGTNVPFRGVKPSEIVSATRPSPEAVITPKTVEAGGEVHINEGDSQVSKMFGARTTTAPRTTLFGAGVYPSLAEAIKPPQLAPAEAIFGAKTATLVIGAGAYVTQTRRATSNIYKASNQYKAAPVYKVSQPYKTAYKNAQPYKSTYKASNQYKAAPVYKVSQPYKTAYKNAQPYKSTYKADELFKSLEKNSYKDTFKSDEVFKTPGLFKETTPFKTTETNKTTQKQTQKQQQKQETIRQPGVFTPTFPPGDTGRILGTFGLGNRRLRPVVSTRAKPSKATQPLFSPDITHAILGIRATSKQQQNISQAVGLSRPLAFRPSRRGRGRK